MTRLPAMLGALCALAALPAGAQQKFAPVDESAYRSLIAAHKGRVVLVNFWATYCKPCRVEMPDLVRIADKLRSKGLDMLSISTDSPEREQEALRFLTGAKVPGPLYIEKTADDDKFYASVDAKWAGELPALFLYDRSGKKVQVFLGEKPVSAIEAAIAKLL